MKKTTTKKTKHDDAEASSQEEAPPVRRDGDGACMRSAIEMEETHGKAVLDENVRKAQEIRARS